MRPGIQIDLPSLMEAAAPLNAAPLNAAPLNTGPLTAGPLTAGLPDNEGQVTAAIAQVTTICPDVEEALHLLSEDAGHSKNTSSVAAVARRLGVRPRNLQRMLLARTGRPPGYWRLLARARRAGRRIAGGDTLVEVALSSGYADQSHMTREIRRWLGTTPYRLRTDMSLREQLSMSGYGNVVTGEQISTRKPLGSRT